MRGFLERDFPKLLELLYDAALDRSRWQAFLDALPSSFGGARGIVHFIDARTDDVPLFAEFGHDPTHLDSLAAHYASVNPYPSIGFQRLPVGQVVYADDYLPAGAVTGTEFFNDWMKPQGITPDHLALSLRNGDEGVALIGIAPHKSVYSKDRDRYSRQLQLLSPHLVRALKINRVTLSARHAEQILGGTLDALDAAAVVVDRAGRPLIMNTKAQALLRARGVITIDRFKTLHAANSQDEQALSTAIEAVASGRWRHTPAPLRLRSRTSDEGFIVWIVPINPSADGRPRPRSDLFASVLDERMVLVLIRPINRSLTVTPQAVQAIFGLTAAEGRLASALAAGRTVVEYAVISGIAHNTVRNQLASIFEKTGTTRQPQLVARLIAVLGSALNGGGSD